MGGQALDEVREVVLGQEVDHGVHQSWKPSLALALTSIGFDSANVWLCLTVHKSKVVSVQNPSTPTIGKN